VLLTIALILFVVWIVGFALFRVVIGGGIHFILILALIALVWHLVSGPARARSRAAAFTPWGCRAQLTVYRIPCRRAGGSETERDRQTNVSGWRGRTTAMKM
jgi:hypothetical protein